MINARIGRLVYGAYDNKTGVCGSSIDLRNTSNFKHKIDIKGGVMKSQCGSLLTNFFQTRR